MLKILILADIPAPYRKKVFQGLSKVYDTDVFFNTCKSEHRNPKWFTSSDNDLSFDVINTKEAKAKYYACIKRIQDYDLVISYSPWENRSRALQRLCIRKKVPYIINADGALGISTNFLKMQIKSFYTKRAALCFAGCERAVEYFKTYGAKSNNIVKHPFTSLDRNQLLTKPLTPEQKSQKKESLQIDQKIMFIAVGQFIHRKAFDLLLEAWEKTSQAAQLYIIGGGPLESQYLQTIETKNLKNVHLIGYMTSDQLLEYYLAADAFIMSTREDIWGLVVNEAMAAALPVISSDRCTAGNELVKHGVNGFIYPCEDTELLAKYIETLQDDPQLLQKFSENSLLQIADYVLENIVDSHVKSINEYMNKRGRKG